MGSIENHSWEGGLVGLRDLGSTLAWLSRYVGLWEGRKGRHRQVAVIWTPASE